MSYSETCRVSIKAQKRLKYLSVTVVCGPLNRERNVFVYLWGLFATGGGGSTAGGGQGGGAGLGWALLSGRGHLVQTVLPG